MPSPAESDTVPSWYSCEDYEARRDA